VEGRAAALEPAVGLVAEALAQAHHETGLAHPRLGPHQQRLPLAALGSFPAVEELRDLVRAPHEWRQLRSRRLDRPAHPARANRPAEGDRLGDALQRLRAELLDDERCLDQMAGRFAQHDRVGRGDALHARGEVRGVSQGQPLALGLVAHLGHHDGAAMDSNPRLERVLAQHGIALLQSGVERRE